MAINLAKKYSPKVVEKFKKSSYFAGKVSDDYDFAGVRTITIYSLETVELGNYDRTATSNRFGTPSEVQDTIQELTLSQDKAFTLTIDKGNNSDQLGIKEAGKMLKRQLDEKSIPYMDKYALNVWATKAGEIAPITAPTKSTIVGLLADGLTFLDNKLVPDEGRFIVLGATQYNNLRLSSEVLAVDPMAQKTLGKGVMGLFMDTPIIKVPDSYIPTNCHFVIIYRESCLFPMKLKTLRILSDVAGIDGKVLEGRHYFDAFVKGTIADGIYTAVTTAFVQADVTITPTGASHALTSASATGIKYTIDGTDPRYSPTAVVYASAVTLTSGQTIKAYAYRTGYFDSGVTSALYTA